MNTRSLTQRLALAALVALALPVANAQDAERPTDRPSREAMAERHLARVQERLNLSAQQAGIVEQALAQREPGSLWAAAAALAPTLSDEQRARLSTPPERPGRATDAERPQRDRSDRMQRGDRAGRADRAGQEPGEVRRERPDRSEALESMKAARNAALGLSAEQVTAFDRLEARHREAMEARRAERGERSAEQDAERAPRAERQGRGPLPEEVAEILSDEQETIWLVHSALAPRFHGGHGRH